MSPGVSPAVVRPSTTGARVPLLVTAAAVPLYAVWALWLATPAGDLAAQVAWADFAGQHPGSAYNLSWYGGVHPANYSLITPHLMAFGGVRTVSVAAGLGATWALAALLCRLPGVTAPLWPAVLAAVTLWCDIASGRTTFAVGVAVACWACHQAHRPAVGAAVAALAAAASPMAGLFLLVAGAAHLLLRHRRAAIALLAPVAVVQLLVAWAFPYWGEQPMTARTAVMPLIMCVATAWAAPRAWGLVRAGAALYAIGVLLTLLITSPIGSNVERLALITGPPVLLAARLARAPQRRRPRTRAAVLTAAAVAASLWVLGKSADDLRHSAPVPARAAHTHEVTGQLLRLGADRSRIEVVPARDHREAWLLGRRFHLARGWNRQLDVERGRLFYDGTFSASTYRVWLDHWAVSHVVLQAGVPDGPAAAEAALVQAGPPYLKPVWRDGHWTIFAVARPVPMVRGPARVVRSTAASLVIQVDEPGPVTVRVRFSPWLRAGGGATVTREGPWSRLTVPRAGRYRLSAPYLPRPLPLPR